MTRIIIIEGIDGAGKTTIAKKLSMTIDNSVFISKKTLDASTDYQKEFMSLIKKPLWDNQSLSLYEIDEESWLYLHMLWYHMVQEFVLKKYIDTYEYIIIDGWYFKFLARHIVNDKMDVEFAFSLFSRLIQGDIVMLLDVSPDICYQRKSQVSSSECGIHKHFQQEYDNYSKFCHYQNEVISAYNTLAEYYHFVFIDASGTIEETAEQIIQYISTVL